MQGIGHGGWLSDAAAGEELATAVLALRRESSGVTAVAASALSAASAYTSSAASAVGATVGGAVGGAVGATGFLGKLGWGTNGTAAAPLAIQEEAPALVAGSTEVDTGGGRVDVSWVIGRLGLPASQQAAKPTKAAGGRSAAPLRAARRSGKTANDFSP